MSRLAPATPLVDVTEKEWDAQLFNSKKGLATSLGWRLVYHTLRSKGSRPGFPDRVLVRDRVIFAELKTETGKPSDRQHAWLTGLAAAGAEVYLWRPSDLEDVGRILSGRWHKRGLYLVRGGAYPTTVDEYWTPGSLWLPAGCRAEERG